MSGLAGEPTGWPWFLVAGVVLGLNLALVGVLLACRREGRLRCSCQCHPSGSWRWRRDSVGLGQSRPRRGYSSSGRPAVDLAPPPAGPAPGGGS